MTLTEYFAAERGRAAALAARLNLAPAFLSQMASGYRPVAPATAVAIERATGGAVTRRDLRPADWAAIWPELVAEGA